MKLSESWHKRGTVSAVVVGSIPTQVKDIIYFNILTMVTRQSVALNSVNTQCLEKSVGGEYQKSRNKECSVLKLAFQVSLCLLCYCGIQREAKEMYYIYRLLLILLFITFVV